MRRLCSALLLVLLISQVVTPTPIFDRDATVIQNGHRSLSFGETIRDWFRVLKNRIVGKWQEWFGDDSPTPNFSPQDILNIDKTIGSRVQSLSDFFLDLWEDYGPDSDSDEWDIKPRMPLPPIWKIDCTPNTGGSGIPEVTRPPTTTPEIEPTTLQRETPQIITQTESSGLTSVVPTASTTETIVISTEQIPSVTEPATISTVTSTPEISSESSTVTAEEPIVIPNVESTLTSIEPITIFTESTLPSTEIIFTESITTSTEPIQISTEPPTTSTDLILPVLNKRVEDNETVVKRTKKPNNQRGSAEVIMF